MAEVLRAAGQPENAADVIKFSLAEIAATEERWWEPETHRIISECHLAHPVPDVMRAETSFRLALTTARRIAASWWDLRDATGMAKLLFAQSRAAETRKLLEIARTGLF